MSPMHSNPQNQKSERAQIAEIIVFCIVLFFCFFNEIMAILSRFVGYVALFIFCLFLFAGLLGLTWRILRGIGCLQNRESLLSTLNLITKEKSTGGIHEHR